MASRTGILNRFSILHPARTQAGSRPRLRSRVALFLILFGALGIGSYTISSAWGLTACSIDDAFGNLGRDCAKYKLGQSKDLDDFEILEVRKIVDVTQHGHPILRADFVCRLKSDPESIELTGSDLFSKSGSSWNLVHR